MRSRIDRLRRSEGQPLYEYPTHLRDAIQDLPHAPGVYVFHGDDGDLPVYIGKSVDLRSRVLSHLRTVTEARMLRQTRRISHIRTAGEIGALLLEASMIKQQQPLHNKKLRRNRLLYAFKVQHGVPSVVDSRAVDFAHEADLYGLFASRHGAQEALRNIADEQKLCYAALGLEKGKPGKPCFRAMLAQCAGLCRGDERMQAHQARLMLSLQAFKLMCWPYPGAVGLIERDGATSDIHVIHNWCYLGTVGEINEAKKLSVQAAGFDADGYKILCGPVLREQLEIVLL
ncbi:excinuclease Cho [Roseateles sp.]|uniref:excinuclease Cho n=1 Tax=Roseateles sp. TaxID=1971397 RepID=UPI00286B1916|nr:excinuclease Cho [Roseateles sp.]